MMFRNSRTTSLFLKLIMMGKGGCVALADDFSVLICFISYLRGGVLLAMMTSLALPCLRVLSVCL